MDDRVDWARHYYTKAGEYWAGGATPDELTRLDIVRRLCTGNGLSILELGAGEGDTAVALANAGHDVVAIEFSPRRVERMRVKASQVHRGRLDVVEEDFYAVDLGRRFDLVCYWNGFGIGNDADQRRLLRRISGEWLQDGGCALVDVFSPWRWIKDAGMVDIFDRNHPSHVYRQRRRRGYDPIANAFVDSWCPIDDATNAPMETMEITQTIRCYSPADLLLLLDGTGLKVTHAEVGGLAFDTERQAGIDHALWNSYDYLVKLERI